MLSQILPSRPFTLHLYYSSLTITSLLDTTTLQNQEPIILKSVYKQSKCEINKTIKKYMV